MKFPKENIIDRYLIKLSPEEREKLNQEIEENINHLKEMRENGLEYCTDTSPSLLKLNQHGFYPTAITSHTCEETFIFRTKKEAHEAYKKMEKELGEVIGWYYSEKSWKKELEMTTQKGEIYEKGHPKIYKL